MSEVKRELPLMSPMSEEEMREIAEKLMEPNVLMDDIHGYIAWHRWQKRGAVRRVWDRLLGRKPPPEPPLVTFKFRTELPPMSFRAP